MLLGVFSNNVKCEKNEIKLLFHFHFFFRILLGIFLTWQRVKVKTKLTDFLNEMLYTWKMKLRKMWFKKIKINVRRTNFKE